MYKVACVSGNINDIAQILRQTINDINLNNGSIREIVQSQSSNIYGQTIVTVTIIYTTV